MNATDFTDEVRVSEALRRTGFQITANHVTRLIRAGRIPARRVGSHWYLHPEDLTETLLNLKAQPSAKKSTKSKASP